MLKELSIDDKASCLHTLHPVVEVLIPETIVVVPIIHHLHVLTLPRLSLNVVHFRIGLAVEVNLASLCLWLNIESSDVLLLVQNNSPLLLSLIVIVKRSKHSVSNRRG